MNRSVRTGAALLGAAGVFALAGCGAVTVGGSDDEDTTTPSADESTETSDSSGDEQQTGDYADGTYTATGDYTTPGGGESVTVTVTLEDGTVTAVDVEGSATGGDSARYQGEFIDGIADEVVGVDIDDLNVSRVGGSSLTSGGFNRAIETILSEAAA